MTPAPSLPEIIHLVEAETDAADPLSRLRTASTLAERLTEVGDAALGYFVDQARHAGHSWSEIGEALGVSKQAAQQRHTVRPAPAVDVFERSTPRARNAVADAAAIARRWGHPRVDTEHLLLALYRDPDALAAVILVEAGLPEGRVADAVQARLGRGTAAADGELPFAPDVRTVFSGALAAAVELGHNYIGTEHLLLGLRRAGGLAQAILDEAGLSAEDLEQRIVRRLVPLRRGPATAPDPGSADEGAG